MLEQVWGSGVIKSAGHGRLCMLGVSALRKYIMGLLLNSGLSMNLADDELVSLLVVFLCYIMLIFLIFFIRGCLSLCVLALGNVQSKTLPESIN